MRLLAATAPWQWWLDREDWWGIKSKGGIDRTPTGEWWLGLLKRNMICPAEPERAHTLRGQGRRDPFVQDRSWYVKWLDLPSPSFQSSKSLYPFSQITLSMKGYVWVIVLSVQSRNLSRRKTRNCFLASARTKGSSLTLLGWDQLFPYTH